MIEYKFFKNAIIPRSSYIKKRIFDSFKDKSEIIVNYYRGKKPVSENLAPNSFVIEPNESLYQQIQKLRLFTLYRFDWYSNEKYILRDEQLSQYLQTLTLCTLFFNLKGAVALRVDVPNKILEITLLEVDKKSQKNGYGEILLHASILIGVLFGCSYVCLESTTESIDFYEKQGFSKNGILTESELQPMFLDLTNILSLDKIQSRFNRTCPKIDLSKELAIAIEQINFLSFVVNNRTIFSVNDLEKSKVPPHMIQQPIYTPRLDLLAGFAKVELDQLEVENILDEPHMKRKLPPNEEPPAKHRKTMD